MNNRFVRWVTVCSAAIRQFVPWVTTCFLVKDRQEQKRIEPTRQELVVIASEEAGFSNLIGCWSILQNKTGLRCSWKKCCIYQTKIYGRIQHDKKHPWTTPIGPFVDVFVSEDQSLLCIDIEVWSPVHDAAWVRVSREVTQWACQSSELAANNEGIDTVFTDGGTAVVHAQPEDLDLCIGRPIAFDPEITPQPSDRQPDSARPGTNCFPFTISAQERHIETS